MSTKIYNGLIMRRCTLEQGLQRLKALRITCLALAQDAVAKEVCKRLVFFKDLAVNFSLIGGEETGFWALQKEMREAKVDVLGKGERSTFWDFSFDVCLIPKGEDLLALYYIENDPGYAKALYALGFEDHHYQNSTDRPDEISEQEWEQRKKDWDDALPANAVPADVGFSYQVVGWKDLLDVLYQRDKVVALIPSDESRRSKVAIHLIEMEVTRNHPKMKVLDLIDLIREQVANRQELVALCESPFGEQG